jgi:tricorn protease
MRTWGGLVGISHSLPLVDGGNVTMPDFGMYDPKTGQWLVENHGVDPDIEVENPPDKMVAGHDPQLERAIAYVMDEMKKHPLPKPERPPYKTQKSDDEIKKAAAARQADEAKKPDSGTKPDAAKPTEAAKKQP